MRKPQSTALNHEKDWERFVDDSYSILKGTHLENFFHHINNLHQNIYLTMSETKKKISVFVCRKSSHTVQFLHYNFHHQTKIDIRKDRYQESIISIILMKITNSHSLNR